MQTHQANELWVCRNLLKGEKNPHVKSLGKILLLVFESKQPHSRIEL